MKAGIGALLVLLMPQRIWGRPGDVPIALLIGASGGVALYLMLSVRNCRAPIAWPQRRLWTRFVLHVLAAAFFEELVWRGLALQVLREYISFAAALSVSTVGFAVLHYESQGARGVATHLVTGSVFAGLVLITGSLAAAATAHGTYNLFAVPGRSRQRPRIPMIDAARR